MARFSQACRLLREPCEDAAVDRGYELGYDEFASDDKGKWELPPGVGNIFRLLFRLHVDSTTARLPPCIWPDTGSAALHSLRTDFAHFQPRLCLRLKLPEQIELDLLEGFGSGCANAAALFSLAGVADDVSAPAIQAMIEGAWAEGMDRRGSTRFDGKLVGKTGLLAHIGANQVLVALWHKRCNAFLIDIAQPASTLERAPPKPMTWVRRIVTMLFEDWDVELPIFMQIDDHSCLIVGVTKGNRKSASRLRPNAWWHSGAARQRTAIRNAIRV